MPKKNILIIDDDPDFVDSIELILQRDFEVTTLNNTLNIIPDIKSLNPDLILLDIMFPESIFAGITALEEIKSDKSLKNLPIVILSAFTRDNISSFDSSHEMIKKLGKEKIIEKPVEPKRLLEIINNLL